MTAHLDSGISITDPVARLNAYNPGQPFAVIDVAEDTYLRYRSAADVLPMLRAHLKAWRLLNPDGPLDALMSELLDEPDLAKILAAAHAAPDTAQPEDTPVASCERCKTSADAAVLVLEDGAWYCHNTGACGRRAQAQAVAL